MSIDTKLKLTIPKLIEWVESGSDVAMYKYYSCKLLNAFDIVTAVINGANEFEILGEKGKVIIGLNDIKDIGITENICCIKLKENRRAQIYIYKMPIGA